METTWKGNQHLVFKTDFEIPDSTMYFIALPHTALVKKNNKLFGYIDWKSYIE
jgi:hypothetical protein